MAKPCSNTLVPIYQTTRCQIPKDTSLELCSSHLHVPLSSQNLFLNSFGGVYPPVSLLVFLPHTHILSLSLSVSLHSITRSITSRRLMNMQNTDIRPAHWLNATALQSTEKHLLPSGYKTFASASFVAFCCWHYCTGSKVIATKCSRPLRKKPSNGKTQFHLSAVLTACFHNN